MGLKQILPLLLLCAVSGRKTYQLFAIPSFRINLIALPPLQNPNDPSELLSFGKELKDAANVHLFQTFRVELNRIHQIPLGGDSPVSTIELEVAVHNEFGGTQIRADMIGNVWLEEMQGVEINQALVRDMVEIAFNTTAANADFLDRLQVKLPAVQSVDVETDLEDTDGSNSSSTIPTVNTVIEGDGTIDKAASVPGGSNAVVVSMSVALVALLIGLFAYVRRDQLSYKKGNLLIDNDQQSDFSEEDGFGRLLGELELDEASYASLEDGDGIQFVPVPAKIDKEHENKATRALKDVQLQPRRYVNPGSPFELLYGASFSHRDQAKVARAHGAKKFKQPKSMKVSGKKIRKKAPLQPMVPITEVNEEEAKVQTTEHFFPQMMSTISSFLKDKTTPSNATENEEEPFVYRDFPRHDGTPCVLFTNVDNVDWDQHTDEEQALTSTSKGSDSAPTNADEPPKKEKEIDSFVDKLENLMAARCRQYEERKELDKEMASRRLDYLAKRAKADTEECKSLSAEEKNNDDDAPLTSKADEVTNGNCTNTEEKEPQSSDAVPQINEISESVDSESATLTSTVEETSSAPCQPVKDNLVPLSLEDEEISESIDSDLKTDTAADFVESKSSTMNAHAEDADVDATAESKYETSQDHTSTENSNVEEKMQTLVNGDSKPPKDANSPALTHSEGETPAESSGDTSSLQVTVEDDKIPSACANDNSLPNTPSDQTEPIEDGEDNEFQEEVFPSDDTEPDRDLSESNEDRQLQEEIVGEDCSGEPTDDDEPASQNDDVELSEDQTESFEDEKDTTLYQELVVRSGSPDDTEPARDPIEFNEDNDVRQAIGENSSVLSGDSNDEESAAQNDDEVSTFK